MDDLGTRLAFLTIVFLETLTQKKETSFKDHILDEPLHYYYNMTKHIKFTCI